MIKTSYRFRLLLIKLLPSFLIHQTPDGRHFKVLLEHSQQNTSAFRVIYFYLLIDFADFLIGTENKLHCTTA